MTARKVGIAVVVCAWVAKVLLRHLTVRSTWILNLDAIVEPIQVAQERLCFHRIGEVSRCGRSVGEQPEDNPASEPRRGQM